MWQNDTCARCLAVVDYIKAHVACFCRVYGGLYEEMEYYVGAARQVPGFAFGILRRVVAAGARLR